MVINVRHSEKTAKEKYLQFGCGFSVGDGWLNFDSSPTLRIERLPVLGKVLGRFAGNAQSFPKAVRYGDIVKGLLAAPQSLRGVYASHVLEHLSLKDFKTAVSNTFDMLEPGGVFRLIVPDLEERARRYIASAELQSTEAAGDFMRATHLGTEDRASSLLARLRAIYGGSAHLWMWDEASLSRELEEAGFVEIRRCEFNDASDEMFSKVESAGRFTNEGSGIVELAMEARKPS